MRDAALSNVPMRAMENVNEANVSAFFCYCWYCTAFRFQLPPKINSASVSICIFCNFISYSPATAMPHSTYREIWAEIEIIYTYRYVPFQFPWLMMCCIGTEKSPIPKWLQQHFFPLLASHYACIGTLPFSWPEKNWNIKTITTAIDDDVVVDDDDTDNSLLHASKLVQ